MNKDYANDAMSSWLEASSHGRPIKREKNKTEKPKILITGASGYIGFQLTNHLNQKGYNVRCLIQDSKKEQALKGQNNEIINGDLLSYQSIYKSLKEIDQISTLPK